jgi:hypothetical protein
LSVICRSWFNSVFLVFAITAIAACGDGGGAPATSNATSSSASSADAPAISGKPADEITVGSTFSFVPEASDPNGSPLTFTIANKPPWAEFSPSTGRLSGTPGAGDVGTYPGVTITVSDGMHRVSLVPFTVGVVGTATGSLTVSWMPPLERSDGSALTNLAGYKIYWGTAPGDYANMVTIDTPGVTSYVLEQLPAGTYYLVMTAFDAAGVESGQSSVAVEIVS